MSTSRNIEPLSSLTHPIAGDGALTWREHLSAVVDTMREISLQTDPQAMVRAYAARMRQFLPVDRSISLSRRGLEYPRFRVTRTNLWKEDINPWKQQDRLPVLEGGLLAELIYGDEPRLIDDLDLTEDDPAGKFLAGQRSVMALPLYDGGVALNMVVLGRRDVEAFRAEAFPALVWLSNLFGRATHHLVLSEELQKAYEAVDSEMQAVANIQRSLLPEKLPEIPGMSLAAYYQTSRRAGGDYYDVFKLPAGKWGVLIADVSGHGTPAAVVMAITHTIAHSACAPRHRPAEMLAYMNQALMNRYTEGSGTFVTAFYGIFDPATRKFTYGRAGHEPPRIKHCSTGELSSLNGADGFPLGLFADQPYTESERRLMVGDQIVFYTDGITEAQNPAGELFGADRLDRALQECRVTADELIQAVLDALAQFTADRPADDDRTMMVAKIT